MYAVIRNADDSTIIGAARIIDREAPGRYKVVFDDVGSEVTLQWLDDDDIYPTYDDALDSIIIEEARMVGAEGDAEVVGA